MLTQLIITQVTSIIDTIGYFGVFILMAMESTMTPVPSEAVVPFAGFLVATGKFNFLGVLLASTFGCLAGSLFSYSLGYYGGMPFVRRFGKIFLMDEEHLKNAEKWFTKKGGLTIFIGRFIPGIRHVISIPAGIGKMNLMSFSIFTFIGAGIWNAILIWVGYSLEKNWGAVYHYAEYVDAFVILVISMALVYYLVRIIDNYRK